MRELLRLFGYEGSDIEAELPRVQKAFTKLGIGDEDITRGKERLNTYYDMELKGVRKIFGIILRELVSLTLAKEEGKERVINACMAPGFGALGSVVATHCQNVCIAVPNHLFTVIFGCVFGKIVDLVEAAEELWLKNGVVAHCANVKNRVGLLALNLVPKPDLMVTNGAVCETSPKTNDLIHELWGIPVYYYDTCQDREVGDFDDTMRVIRFAASGMRRLARRIQEEVGIEITDEMVWEAIRATDRCGAVVRQIWDLIQKSDRVPLSSTHYGILRRTISLPLSITDRIDAANVLTMLYEELKERVDRGVGVLESRAPKILSMHPNHDSDPRLEHLAKEVGLACVATDPEFSLTHDKAIPIDKTLEDPYEEISQYLWSSLYLPLGARISVIIDTCRSLKIKGVFDRYHVGCRGNAGDALIIKDAVTKELGIPVVLLEWENFDPRVFDLYRYKSCLQGLKAMIEAREHNSNT